MCSNPAYIDVVLNVPINQTFTYRIPEGTEQIQNPFGLRVEVKFGNRKTSGFVSKVHESLPPDCAVSEEKIRTAIRYIDKTPVLTRELWEIAEFMSGYYISPIGECVFSMIPSGKRETEVPGLSFSEDETEFEKKQLSPEQKSAADGIISSAGKFHYLYGTTGSGKTEVFLSAAEKVISQGKGVIYLVPEIGLTPQVVKAVQKRFGSTVAVLHSALTPSQRLREWKRILDREARIAVGARSAVFAPMPELGLIIIDEEHDSSYKSGSSPRYHARQIAMLRCKRNSIPLVMGSATPSAESWLAMQSGTIEKHSLTRRLAGGEAPEIKCVNLALEPDREKCISRQLQQEIKTALSEKKQAILFLNRRGFTHFFRCTSCGYELKCRNCSVPMTYHKSENRLRCHYCGYSLPPPQQCPKCGSLDTGYSGFGTEYIEAEVKAKFPNAKVMRIDTDSLHHKGELQEKLDLFRNGSYDILLGTQMVAKGLNFPNLKVAGVILADTTMHLPDFRAAEKTFSLITQVAGRAGRFFPGGKVIVQSYCPENEAIRCAVNGQPEEFYKNELDSRKILHFPPYSRLLRLVFRSQNQKASQHAAESAFAILVKCRSENVDILGPAECPLEMVNGSHRFQIILRSTQIRPLQEMAKKLVWGFKPPRDVYIETDTDPVSML
ncbi:replication restart helicase PriA [Treponema sp.]|uniref:replication restart helicase PriA n=1 Tax=Treponema sp. TaxID=166 RepID=UPI003F128B26